MATPKDFGFTEDISMLKDTFAKFLSEQKTIENLRPSLKGTEDPYHGDQRSAFYDTQSWQQTVELGIHAVSIPEDQGGIGITSFINNVYVFISISSVIIKHTREHLIIAVNKFGVAIFLSLYCKTLTVF